MKPAVLALIFILSHIETVYAQVGPPPVNRPTVVVVAPAQLGGRGYVQRPTLAGSNAQNNLNQYMANLSQMFGGVGTPQDWINGTTGDPDGPSVESYRSNALTGGAVSEDDLRNVDCSHNSGNRFICSVCNVVFEACTTPPQPPEGREAVIRTVLTRVFNTNYPDTVCKNVYYQSKGVAAFSWTNNGQDHHLSSRTSCLGDAIKATNDAFRDGPNGKDHYYNPTKANPAWGSGATCRDPVMIGGGAHKFCTEHGSENRTLADVNIAEGITSGSGDGVGQ